MKNDLFLPDYLYDHQKDIIKNILTSNKKEVALFLEMGTMKTLLTLVLLTNWFNRRDIDQVLLIAPNNLHFVWLEEIERWKLNIATHVFQSNKCKSVKYKKAYAAFDKVKDKLKIFFVNVETFSGIKHLDSLRDYVKSSLTAVVIDEATVIKNFNSKRTGNVIYTLNEYIVVRRSAKNLVRRIISYNSAFRVILTGTPITNNVTDIFSLMYFLNHTTFREGVYAFKNKYLLQNSIFVHNRQIMVTCTQEFLQKVKKYFRRGISNQVSQESLIAAALFKFKMTTYDIRYIYENINTVNGPVKYLSELKEACVGAGAYFLKKKQCLDLPEKSYMTIKVVLDKEIKPHYLTLVKNAVAEWKGQRMTPQNVLSVIIRAQQLLSGVFVVSNENKTWLKKDYNKLKRLLEILDEVRQAIIITKFVDTVENVFNFIGKHNKDKTVAKIISGSPDNAENVNAFKNGDIDLLISTVGLVSHGLNLQNCDTIIFVEQVISVESRLQVEDRIHRPGQGNPCTIIDLIYADTIEEKLKADITRKIEVGTEFTSNVLAIKGIEYLF